MPFNTFSEEIKAAVFKHLSPADKTSSRDTMLFFTEYFADTNLLQTSQAKDYEDFITRAKVLPVKLQKMVLKEIYSLPLAERIAQTWLLSEDQRRQNLLTDQQQSAMPDENYTSYLIEDGGVQALLEGLITPEQAATMPDSNCLLHLFEETGLQAMREKLVSPEQAAAITDSNCLYHLLDNNGLRAIREKLLSPEQASHIKYAINLFCLLDDNGYKALREGLITPEQVAAMPDGDYVCFLLEDEGLHALKQGWITPERAAAMSTAQALKDYLNNCGE